MAVDTTDYTWFIEQGQIEHLNVPVTNNGAPMSVTGWGVDVKIKANPGGPELYVFVPENIAVTGASGTTIALTVPVEDSLEWDFSIGWFRVEITDPESEEDSLATYRVVQGPVVVDPN